MKVQFWHFLTKHQVFYSQNTLISLEYVHFCPRINMLKGNCFKTILRWIMVHQKVPKLYFQSQFSMSKTNRNFSKKKSSKNINLEDHFLLKHSILNFWTTKIRPNFCRPHTMSIHKIKQFHLTTVDFWAKTLLLRTHQARNSMT